MNLALFLPMYEGNQEEGSHSYFFKGQCFVFVSSKLGCLYVTCMGDVASSVVRLLCPKAAHIC